MRLVTDPVCGMKVDPAISPTRVGVDRRAYYFCSTACLKRFIDAPTASTPGRPGTRLHRLRKG